MKGGRWTSTDYEILDKLAVNRIAAREQMIENAPCYMCRASLGRGKRHSCRRCGRTICGDPNCGEKISFSLHGTRHKNIYFCTTCKYDLPGIEGVTM